MFRSCGLIGDVPISPADVPARRAIRRCRHGVSPSESCQSGNPLHDMPRRRQSRRRSSTCRAGARSTNSRPMDCIGSECWNGSRRLDAARRDEPRLKAAERQAMAAWVHGELYHLVAERATSRRAQQNPASESHRICQHDSGHFRHSTSRDPRFARRWPRGWIRQSEHRVAAVVGPAGGYLKIAEDILDRFPLSSPQNKGRETFRLWAGRKRTIEGPHPGTGRRLESVVQHRHHFRSLAQGGSRQATHGFSRPEQAGHAPSADECLRLPDRQADPVWHLRRARGGLSADHRI